MAYDDEEAKRSRVVVETPTERREVVSQSVRTPDRSGISAGMVGVLVVVAIALITMLVLFWMNNQQAAENQNLAAAQPQQTQPPTIIQQPAPAQQPPVIIQQPAPATQPAPVIVTQPSGGATATENIDSTIQAAVDKAFIDDPTFSSLGITATVMDAKVTLMGTVKSEGLKRDAERMVRKIKGVKNVDNQILVVAE